MDVPGEWDEQDASPRPVGVAAAAPVATGSSETKMYTRDFLLNLQKRPQCQELPPGFERDPQLLRSEPAVSWLPPQGSLECKPSVCAVDLLVPSRCVVRTSSECHAYTVCAEFQDSISNVLYP